MPLNINTNTAAASASYFLSKNNAALQKSLNRLSSGTRITKPADDAGGLAVSMKLARYDQSSERSRKEHWECYFLPSSTRWHSRVCRQDCRSYGRTQGTQSRCAQKLVGY